MMRIRHVDVSLLECDQLTLIYVVVGVPLKAQHTAANMGDILLEDIYEIISKDPDGKRFDKGAVSATEGCALHRSLPRHLNQPVAACNSCSVPFRLQK
jgi:hypothetical protein